jgi:tetratricopeptide (TPR) repeat protein
VGELSAAFLAPKTDLHLQFAYYESSLVVEFLIRKFGHESLKAILHDLGAGKDINQAIAAHTAPLDKIESGFAAFARERAERLGPGLDWEMPKAEAARDDKWIAAHPTNYYVLTRQAKRLLDEKKFEEARKPLALLTKLYPQDTSPDNARKLLAEVYHGLGNTNLERETLAGLAALDADDTETFLRLTQLCGAAKDWACTEQNAERVLAVNPFLGEPYRYRAKASEALERKQPAIRAYETMLLLDPVDPAETHYSLARLLRQTGDPAAKRHVLQALEEAPRFRAAHALLLEIIDAAPGQPEKQAP